MADPRFFTRNPPLSLQAVIDATGCRAYPADADTNRLFEDVAPLDSAGPKHIGFLDNPKYAAAFAATGAGACFVRERYLPRAPEGLIALVTEQPYTAFALVSKMFYPVPPLEAGVSPAAHIDPTATLGPGCRVEAGAWVGPRAVLGARCHIGVNAVIQEGVVMGDDCSIGALSSVSHAVLGDRVALHRGVHIGQDGFGFAPGPAGILKVPQLGRVLIENDVEIGSNTCIDRGAGPDTVIGAGAKIDNLVQIGHNVRIGRMALVAGQAGIAGSSRIGDGAMLGGQVGISGHVTVGREAKLAAQAGVSGDIPDGATYGGAPAVPIKDWHRQTHTIAKLSSRSKVSHD